MNRKIGLIIVFVFIMMMLITIFTFFSVKTKAQNNIVKVSDLLNQIQSGEKFYYENLIIEGDLNLTLLYSSYKEIYTEEDIINHKNVRSPLNFYKCIFKGNIVAYYDDKDNFEKTITTFNENLRFTRCEFKSSVSFQHSIFNKNLSFSDCIFYDIVSLDGSTINGEFLIHKNVFTSLSLNRTYIERDIIIYGNKIYRLAISDSNIKGNLLMESNVIDDFTNLYKTHIDRDIKVQNNDFKFNVDFSKIKCEGKSEFLRNNFTGRVQFVESQFNDMRVKDSFFEKETDFYRSDFNGILYIQSIFHGDVEFDLNTYYAGFHIVSTQISGNISFKNIYVLRRFYIYNSFFDDNVTINDSDFVGNFNLILSEFNSNLTITDSMFIHSRPEIEDCKFKNTLLTNTYYNKGIMMESFD